MSDNQNRIEAVRARRREIAAEDRELAAMEAELVAIEEKWQRYQARLGAHISSEPEKSAPSQGHYHIIRSKRAGHQTKNDLIIEALNVPRGLWQTANQVQEYMTAAGGKEVPMSSVSPALTALKKNGTIVRRDMRVALTLRVEREEPGFLNENGPPRGGPDVGGNPASDPPQQPDRAHEGR